MELDKNLNYVAMEIDTVNAVSEDCGEVGGTVELSAEKTNHSDGTAEDKEENKLKLNKDTGRIEKVVSEGCAGVRNSSEPSAGKADHSDLARDTEDHKCALKLEHGQHPATGIAPEPSLLTNDCVDASVILLNLSKCYTKSEEIAATEYTEPENVHLHEQDVLRKLPEAIESHVENALHANPSNISGQGLTKNESESAHEFKAEPNKLVGEHKLITDEVRVSASKLQNTIKCDTSLLNSEEPNSLHLEEELVNKEVQECLPGNAKTGMCRTSSKEDILDDFIGPKTSLVQITDNDCDVGRRLSLRNSDEEFTCYLAQSQEQLLNGAHWCEMQPSGNVCKNVKHNSSKHVVSEVGVQCALALENGTDTHTGLECRDSYRESVQVDKLMANTLLHDLNNAVKALKHAKKFKAVRNVHRSSLRQRLPKFQGLQAKIQCLSEQMIGLKAAVDQLSVKISQVASQDNRVKSTEEKADITEPTSVELVNKHSEILSENVRESTENGLHNFTNLILKNGHGKDCPADCDCLQESAEGEICLPLKKKMRHDHDKLVAVESQGCPQFNASEVCSEKSNALEIMKTTGKRHGSTNVGANHSLLFETEESREDGACRVPDHENTKCVRMPFPGAEKKCKMKLPVLQKIGRRWYIVGTR
eukprot:c27723_g1_i2 orf=725-2665(+)